MQANLRILARQPIQATASGKAILIGEHSVVYGYKALALALPDIKLSLTLVPVDESKSIDPPANFVNFDWASAWHTVLQGKEMVVEGRINQLLTCAFEKALKLVGFLQPLSEFTPQKILIHSQIPLGGGMGGSAAISTCLVRVAAQIVNSPLSIEQETQFANKVDALFHNGKASGLDVTAVASNGIIEFQKGALLKKLNPQCHFWLALVDSGERSETANMIQKVRNHFEAKRSLIEDLFLKLDILASSCGLFLEQGNINKFAECLNTAHECLDKLGVSTPKINTIVYQLKKQGALAAKLTGAGGGGLVLGVFEKEPIFLLEQYGKECVYISYV